MINISLNKINEQVSILSKDEINAFLNKYNIILNNSELDFVYSFIKNNTTKILKNPKSFNLNDYKDHFSEDNYNKLSMLYNKYSNYLDLINITL